MDTSDYQRLRQLLDDYLRMYAFRDDRLTAHFSEDFSGFTGGGDFLVKDREQWVAITRQDFAQVKEPIHIDLKDVAIQSLAETIAVATSFFTIHLPIKDHILSRETARLVLIFRKESEGWKICHSSISIPYHLVREGEVYPMRELVDRNQKLEEVIAERTAQLSEANENLQRTNRELAKAVAEHRQAEEALQRSEELYRSIVTASPDNITITDREGRVVMVSPMAAAMFGGREEEGLGRHVTDFIVPEERERAWSRLALKREGVVTGPGEYRAIRQDGSTFDIEVNSDFIRGPAGSITGMVLIIRDVTERKLAEANKEKLEATNRQLHKTESLSRMAGAIAHHFNNQLGAVMGNLELAVSEIGQGRDALPKMVAAIKASSKAAEISGLMLTYLGQSFDKHEPVDLSELCRQGLPRLQSTMPAQAALTSDLACPGPVIVGNWKQILQVLANLANNAWEALQGGHGAVHVRVQAVAATGIPAAHRFPLDWQPQADFYACLEVTDTGCGVDEKDIEKLFDPFFSSKFTGRGMGLAVVLGIVRVHSGVVIVESKLSQGSTFRVYFPLKEGA